MKSENNGNGSIKLWGHEFKKAKDGLDEEQIVSFVNDLINERDTLMQRQEHLSSLSKLAERTIAEADNVARQVREEVIENANTEAGEIVAKAEDQSRQVLNDTQAEAYDIVSKAEQKAQQILEDTEVEANGIMTKAEEQAQQVYEDKKAEAIAEANEEAEAIKASAQQEVESLRTEKTRMIQSELKNTARQMYGELVIQLEGFKEQVTTLEENFKQVLKESEVTIPAATVALEPVESIDQTEVSEAEDELQQPVENYKLSEYEGEVELEIQPPVDMRKVMGIISYLDSLAEVRTTELIPLPDRPVVKVFLRESMHLIETLRGLSEVAQATEVTGDAEEDKKKIQIALTENSVLDESKKSLNDEIFQILSQ